MNRLIVTLILLSFILSGCGAQPSSPSVTQEPPVALQTEVITESPPMPEPTTVPTPTLSFLEQLEQAAKNEEGVINTYGMPEVWANYGGIFGEFQARYGIVQQDIDMGSSVVLSRMTEENASKNDIADLKPSFAMKLAESGLTSDYQVSCWADLPEGQKGIGKDGSVWYAAYKGTVGWIVNTNLVKEVPRSWADLNNPALKGMVSYLDPRATGTGISTVEAVSYGISGDPYNYQAGAEFLAKLHQAGIIASVDPKVDISKFQRGEVGILINFDYNLLQWKKDLGIPSEVIIPSDGTIANGGGVVAARNAPHPNTAKLFLEFLLCGDGQRLYAQAFVSPMNPNVELPAEIAAQFPPPEAYSNVMFIDYVKDSEISDALKEAWAAATGAQ
jgi:putative spermidine/putrescine transport system substrate-binding protein